MQGMERLQLIKAAGLSGIVSRASWAPRPPRRATWEWNGQSTTFANPGRAQGAAPTQSSGMGRLFRCLARRPKGLRQSRIRERVASNRSIESIRYRTCWARFPGRRPRPCAKKSGNGFGPGFASRRAARRLSDTVDGTSRYHRSKRSGEPVTLGRLRAKRAGKCAARL